MKSSGFIKTLLQAGQQEGYIRFKKDLNIMFLFDDKGRDLKGNKSVFFLFMPEFDDKSLFIEKYFLPGV
jgi:hypothetical protein